MRILFGKRLQPEVCKTYILTEVGFTQRDCEAMLQPNATESLQDGRVRSFDSKMGLWLLADHVDQITQLADI